MWLKHTSSVFCGALLALAAFGGFVYWRVYVWLTTPPGPHMALRGVAQAVDPGYIDLWQPLLWIAGIGAAVLAVELGVIAWGVMRSKREG